MLLCGCPTSGGSDDGSGETGAPVCDTDAIDGQWAQAPDGIEDWSNVATGANDLLFFEGGGFDPAAGDFSKQQFPCDPLVSPQALGYGSFDHSISSHHCFVTAVHAMHLPDNQLLLMHGENDQRVWDIGSEASSMTWHPIPIRTRRDREVDGQWRRAECALPDIFCSGHVQLFDGRVFFAGGNVTGSPSSGGLNDTYLFNPTNARMAPAPGEEPTSTFGWEFVVPPFSNEHRVSPSQPATYDRWYPTLTALGDGRVLIAGGDSRFGTATPPAGATRVLEVYDPFDNSLVPLPGGETAWFPDVGGVPQYPFMFVLPNGHVFYAGSEEADGEEFSVEDPVLNHHGQILVPSPRGSALPWSWVATPSNGIQSFIRGGSAAMYAPGKIIKSGGLLFGSADATADVEIIDLTAYAEDPDPANIPAKFCSTADGEPEPDCVLQPMRKARHFHTLTLLPDGRVLATGGNRRGNAGAADNFWSPCDVNGEYDSESECTGAGTCYVNVNCQDGCPSLCVQSQLDVPPGLVPVCEVEIEPELSRCSLIEAVECSSAAACAVMDMDPEACDVAVSCHVDGAACVPTYTCDEILEGSTCNSAMTGNCTRACDCAPNCDLDNEFDDCGDLLPYFDPDQEQMRCGAATTNQQGVSGFCSPVNNACYATKTSEIWDPTCGAWTEFDEEAAPRMYHSTALLLPDARVISMGGGHRDYPDGNNQNPNSPPGLQEQTTGQYFAPAYADQAPAPEYAGAPQEITILYPGGDDQGPQGTTIPIALGSEPVDHVALLKLGSVTHGFDMGQSLMKLGVVQTGNSITLAESNDLDFPFDTNTAPPGYYMAFLMSAAGEPSEARYVKLTDAEAAGYVCEIDDFVVEEQSCTLEPVSGMCPAGGSATVALTPPTVDGVTGTVSGFRVVAPPGSVGNPQDPSDHEWTTIADRCAIACTQYYDEREGQTANCSDPEAFLPPALVQYPDHAPVDFVHPDERHGEGLFPNNTLACDLGATCYSGFDEVLRPAANDRVTEASAPLSVNEEWRISIAGQMQAWASTGGSPVSSSITGTMGYSLCAAGNASAPCPFYLGSLEFDLGQPLVLPMTCGSSTETHTLSSLSVQLEQPAFGVAQQGTAWKGFPSGSIVLAAEGVVDGVPFHIRRPNAEPVYLRAGQAWTLLQGTDGAWLEFSVPCGDDSADVLVWWGYSGVALDDSPPTATITLPSAVTCPSTRVLTKSVSDADGDLASVRWRVDGVLMSAATTSMTFTQAHQLELVARDARGATTIARKTVGCL